MTENEPIYNIFEALGEPDAETMLAKAVLAGKVSDAIDERGFDDGSAAQIIGCTRRRLGQFHDRRLDDFSLEELFNMLNALGQDVNITVAPAADSTAHLRVAGI